jgi:hypothetical protein
MFWQIQINFVLLLKIESCINRLICLLGALSVTLRNCVNFIGQIRSMAFHVL